MNVINGVYVNLLGATTPDLIRSSLPQDAVGGGLSSRMIFVSEWEKSKVVPFPFLTDENLKTFEKLKHDLEEIYQLRGGFQITDGFKNAWKTWYTNADKNPPFRDNPKFEGYVNRRGNHVLKLCMILSAAESSDMVLNSSVMERAIATLEEVEKKMPSVFYGHGTSVNSDLTGRVLQTVSAMGEKGIHINQLMRTYIGYVGGPDDLTDIIKKLVIAGYIYFDKESQIITPKDI